ncbi:MAG: hypothetical protein HWD61_06400 [Parachlamydiaceae bacterium]|nr:MAG: hypothetical protein HWD61_06400 [Parachlamydiaceae bacterium]
MGCDVINQKRFSAHFNPKTGVVKIDSDANKNDDLIPMTFRYKSADEVRFKRKEFASGLKEGITIEAAKILLVTEKLLSQCHSFSIEMLKNIEETFVNDEDTDINNQESCKDDVDDREKIYRGHLDKAKIQKLLDDEKAERIVTLWRQVNDRSVYPKIFDVKFLIGTLYQSNEIDEKWSPSWKPDDIYHEEMLVVKRTDKSLRFCCAEVISSKDAVPGKLQVNFGFKEVEKEINGKK